MPPNHGPDRFMIAQPENEHTVRVVAGFARAASVTPAAFARAVREGDAVS